MKLKPPVAALALVSATALMLTACGANPDVGVGGAGASASGVPVSCGGKASLTGEGSSAQKNAMDVFIQAYQQRCSGQNVAYNPTGSGAGVKQFTAGLVDFGGSDSPLVAPDQVAAATKRCQDHPAWNLPLVFGPVALGYKLSGVNNLVINGETAAKIFNGRITSWNDPALAALNPGVSLPATPIRVIFRSDESGTTDNFQLYLQAASKGAWSQGAGKSFKGGVGSGAEKSAGVAQATAGTDGAITYVELSFAQDNKLGIAKIDNGSGPVELSARSVGAAIDAVKIKGEGNNLVLDLNSIYGTTQPDAYPLILATYELVCSQGYAPEVAQAIKAFLTVAATDGQANLSEAGYAPLPEAFQKKILTAVEAIAPPV